MNKQIYVIIHIAVWLILFLSPITFMRDDESMSFTRILMISVQPAALMMIFYLNYCWLTPHYFVKGERRLYFFTNIVLIIVLAIAVHFWLDYTHSLFNNDHGKHEKPTLYFHLSFILNNAIQLFISAAMPLLFSYHYDGNTVSLHVLPQKRQRQKLSSRTSDGR